MGSLQNQKFPQWVHDMIHAEFVTGKGKDPNYRGYFCVDCGGRSLRKVEVETQHQDHHVLQAFTCSREYGYNIDDVLKISDLLDVSGVCPYKINTSYVYFPKSRKKSNKNTTKAAAMGCFVCGADLSKSALSNGYQFCSILCKLNSNSSSASSHSRILQENEILLCERPRDCGLLEKKKKCLKLKIKAGVGITMVAASDDDGDHKKRKNFDEEQQQQQKKRQKIITEEAANTAATVSFRKRSRKGVPCRAPLF